MGHIQERSQQGNAKLNRMNNPQREQTENQRFVEHAKQTAQH
jgi:hypothetical protein